MGSVQFLADVRGQFDTPSRQVPQYLFPAFLAALCTAYLPALCTAFLESLCTAFLPALFSGLVHVFPALRQSP